MKKYRIKTIAELKSDVNLTRTQTAIGIAIISQYPSYTVDFECSEFPYVLRTNSGITIHIEDWMVVELPEEVWMPVKGEIIFVSDKED